MADGDLTVRPEPRRSGKPLRAQTEMEWIHSHFKLDGLERLARADRDYADSHGEYLPDVAALAHAALTALGEILELADSAVRGEAVRFSTCSRIRSIATSTLGPFHERSNSA